MKDYFKSNRFLLTLIMLVAVVTRFYDFFSIPLSHDEFSALFRTRYENFGELIDQGVKIDTHPPLIQIWYFYFVNWFGEAPWLIKLPFTLAGIASIWLTYRIGKLWFSETSGLIAASILTVSELGVVYSHFARPYISGLFLCLLMTLYWTKLIKSPEKNLYKNLTLFVVFAVLSAYNHHFSLMFAGLLGLFGLLFVSRKILIHYFISGVVILLLYIPNISIFLIQLEMGGVGEWLSKPDLYFITDFIGYTLNFSFILYFIIAILIFLSWTFWSKKETKLFELFAFIGFFIVAFSIGYVYSAKVNPVIQFSTLIFFLPFLLMGLFGKIRELDFKYNSLIIIPILLIGGITLQSNRLYYTKGYESPYISILEDAKYAVSSNKNTAVVIHSHPKITNYYLSQESNPMKFRWVEGFENAQDFLNFVQESSRNTNQFYLGLMSDVPPYIYPMVKHFYPKVEWQKNYFGATTYLFSKGEPKKEKILSQMNNGKYSGDWKSLNTINFIRTDSTGIVYKLEKNEWSPSTSFEINSILKHDNQFIDAEAVLYPSHDFYESILVLSIDQGEENILYQKMNAKSMKRNSDGSISLFASAKLSDVDLRRGSLDAKIYIWNKAKETLLIKSMTVKLREGNPIIYGQFEPVN